MVSEIPLLDKILLFVFGITVGFVVAILSLRRRAELTVSHLYKKPLCDRLKGSMFYFKERD